MAVERSVMLDPDELSEVVQMLEERGHGKDGGDYEPECPNGVQVGSPQQSADPLDRCKAIRERVAELEAEIKRLTDEHNTLLGTGTVDAEDIAWAQGSAGNAGVTTPSREPNSPKPPLLGEHKEGGNG